MRVLAARRGWWCQLPPSFGLLCAFRVTGGDHRLARKRKEPRAQCSCRSGGPEACSPIPFSPPVPSLAFSRTAGQGMSLLAVSSAFAGWKGSHPKTDLCCFYLNPGSQNASPPNPSYKKMILLAYKVTTVLTGLSGHTSNLFFHFHPFPLLVLSVEIICLLHTFHCTHVQVL